MAANRILVDSSFLFALTDRHDKFHLQAAAFAEMDRSIRIVPDVVLTEVAHAVRRMIGQHAVAPFLQSFSSSSFQLQSVSMDEINRASQIMTKYATANLDFVDSCIMALAERLEITEVCTFDRRDFVIYRRANGEALILLP